MERSAVDLDHDYASGLRPPITYDIVMESGIDLVGTTIMTWHFNLKLSRGEICAATLKAPCEWCKF